MSMKKIRYNGRWYVIQDGKILKVSEEIRTGIVSADAKNNVPQRETVWITPREENGEVRIYHYYSTNYFVPDPVELIEILGREAGYFHKS